MNIGFDGKRAANNLTGLGNYSRSLIAHLAKHFPQNQYFVYSPKVKDHPQIRLFKETPKVHLKLPESKGLFWRSLGIKTQLQKDRLALYHGLSHELPIGIHKTGIPSIVTIHDLIFIRFPQYYGFIDRLIYKFKTKYACKHANRIIAISERTKQDIIELYNIAANKIEVIYQSCDDSFKLPATEALQEQVKKNYTLPDQYILNVGTIEQRKNLLTLIKALKNVNSDYKLVVIGKKTGYFTLVENEIELLGLKDRVLFLQHVPFTDLPAIYQLATAFIYPSLYEGFGIPIIEALYCKVPVVAARGSCLEEAGGESSLYIAPEDDKALAQAINKILDNPELQMEMKEKGSAYVQKFNNEDISAQLMQLYLKTLHNIRTIRK
ncbi:glycosyltransferase family 4 protein [Pedobacter heparinus]|uniref:Glycosyl transferase group 1 n=1 Tax=Pedobacter heparinus (strain ATCC 13125 / DSM 2366 / CIP 104194 / JCM 7457 / NBRC 12017 / NCIMB 9290 / NRRL B-14731 / HIM 762-3) TaxID=485917 RepID=C6Y286_PEDHD|nr:glycosyltransferase family 1 protein [Pedobacter heparinus]ACU03079.1 glycosyl transferase group 1 [Pedobacter heparinus DSM 2366]